jgi:HD-GYP domain-containing protein (c-di-GMP phosphodiesterase class II)
VAARIRRVDARLRLADLLGGLSIVADMGFGLPPETAMRACVLGTGLARKLGRPEGEVADTFYTTLLLHVGCTALAHETTAVFGDDLNVNGAAARTDFADPRDLFATMIPVATRGMSRLARARVAAYLVTRGKAFAKRFDTGSCEVARATARRIGLGDGVQAALYEVHEWWNGGGARGLAGEGIALPARIARLATDVALFNELGGAAAAEEALTRRAGGMLDPSLVDAFRASGSELLGEVATHDPRERILEIEPEPVIETASAELRDLARAFGDLADLKMPCTHGHSSAVSGLACAAADRVHLDRATRAQLEVAALLHDLGRVGVSNAVWEKPGPLSAAEWEQVRMHPYYSERILSRSGALEPIARIAGMHHERLDGSGYHRSCRGNDIPVACRILAAADAFQAMTARRGSRIRRLRNSPALPAPACSTPTRLPQFSRRPASVDRLPATPTFGLPGLPNARSRFCVSSPTDARTGRSRGVCPSRPAPPTITCSTSTRRSGSRAAQRPRSSPSSTTSSPQTPKPKQARSPRKMGRVADAFDRVRRDAPTRTR